MNTKSFEKALSAADETLSALGFYPTGSIIEDNDKAEIEYKSDKGNIKFTYKNEKLFALDENDKRLMASLLPEDATDKEIKFIGGEIASVINDKYGEKKTAVQKKSNGKMPQTVSKAAVKAGSFYDENSLAAKLGLIYPELRLAHKANVDKYGEFLAQEFFVDHATPKIISTIKSDNPAMMKRLFQTLNEMYEDGTNDLQSLIAVTILGELNNDQILLARCVDYMSETMAPPVIEVNKFLATSKGKRAKEKMKNPPAYKPKKAKKPGIMERLMGAQAQGLQQ